MIRTARLILAAVALISAVGCATIDDHEAQAEYEKLRSHPNSSLQDPILPVFDSSPTDPDELAVG